ncbi:MAG: hypothetical protein EBR91_11595 [Flavobacteriia bacterium]|nr:hypothetical protein [Flavobacteriia bacterium]
MLKIQRNGATPLIVTVTELTTIPNPNYLFEFIHEQSFNTQTCVLTNVSTTTQRFDEFVLTDGVDVNFIYDGFYIYNIFQQSSPGNLDPVNSQGLVETGRAHVVEADSPSYEYDSPIYFNIYE